MTDLQKEILWECLECVRAWTRENWEQAINIDYSDYVNVCYNYGGDAVRVPMDDLLADSSDEEQQPFYDEVCFQCERENRGIRSAVGNRIKYLRTSQGLTQEELAAKAGITRANLSNIEAGKYSVGLDILERIAKALNVSIIITEL